jgi:hypothetical protein
MNAGLAKPIPAIWFIGTKRLICINRMLRRFLMICRRGCATISRCLDQTKNIAMHN